MAEVDPVVAGFDSSATELDPAAAELDSAMAGIDSAVVAELDPAVPGLDPAATAVDSTAPRQPTRARKRQRHRRSGTMAEEEEASEDDGNIANTQILVAPSVGCVRLATGALSSFRDEFHGDEASHRCASVEMATVPSELISQEAELQRSKHAALSSVAAMKSLLSKRKSSASNAPNHPTKKRKKSSTSHVQIVRSPILNRMIVSPRIRTKRLRSPSLTRYGSQSPASDRSPSPALDRSSLSPTLDRSPSVGSPSSRSPDDTSIDLHLQDVSRPVKRRKLRSAVWKDFEPIYDGNLVVQAKCTHCLEIFSATRDNGRSACSRHLKTCHQRARINQMLDNLNSLSLDAITLKNWKFDQEVSRQAMVNFIVLQELPFSLVDHEPFRKFIATLNPLFTIVSRTTVVQDIISSYDKRRLALREIIKNSDSRVCLTSDLWTSSQNLGYLCITCHFIDNNWTLQKRIISLGLVASPHDGITMFNALLKGLQDWQLDHKVFSITLDNAKNNNRMVTYLRKNLLDRHLLPGNGDLLHMRCAAHVLNLIVQEGFKIIDSAISHIRDSVKYIRSSQGRKQRFEEIIVQVGISCGKRPTLDVPTRWNSTYLMLESSLKYRNAFDALYTQDPSYMDLPSVDEWNMADLLCTIFKPFYDATLAVSGSLYPTSNQYFHVLWKVKEVIEKEVLSTKVSIATMAAKMKEKFQKYWDLSFLQICVPVVLDPRFKLSFVAFRLNAGFGTKGPTYTLKVKSAVNDLFAIYSSDMPNIDSTTHPPDDDIVHEEWADWEKHLTAQRKSKVKSDLDVFLKDDLFPRQRNFDILQWWKMHSSKYPVLSLMARDVFAAPASTVPSECAFSSSGRVIGEYRSRLTSKNVEALICLQDWLRAEGHPNLMIEDIGIEEDQSD